jgi:hypothetical protein
MGIVTVLSFLRGPGRTRVELSHDADEGIPVQPEPSDSATETANVGFSQELFPGTAAADDPGNQPPSIAELLRPQVAEPVSEADDEKVSEQAASVENALASVAEVVPERYQARENGEGWSVQDGETGDTAEIYGYRLTKMNRARAESLVAVLNRGEARSVVEMVRLSMDLTRPRDLALLRLG